MNIVFFGSSDFAVPALEAIADSAHKVICVVTQPDKQKGRGLLFASTAVKAKAAGLGLKIYQPSRINSPEAAQFLGALKPDLLVVAAYGQILPQRILDTPKIFALNLHASLLPKYRGAAPVNWAIINGEAVTGATIIQMARRMDAGKIILQKSIDIKQDETCIALGQRLSGLGAGLLLEALRSIEKDQYHLRPQNEDDATYAPRLCKKDGQINWAHPAQDIYNQIRGCLGWPGAFTYYQGKLFKICGAELYVPQGPDRGCCAGEIVEACRPGIVVAAAGGYLRIKELQVEGKRKMTAEEFIAGHKMKAGERFLKK